MRDRNRRESARRRDFMEWQHSRERDHGHDQPSRDERRNRYPDEPYGGDRGERWSPDERQSYRGRANEGIRQWTDEHRRGADYRGDFGPEGVDYFRREQQSGRGWDHYPREGDEARGSDRGEDRRAVGRGRERGGFGRAIDRWNTGASFGFGPQEGVDDRDSDASGSPYGQRDMNSDPPGRGWRDSDWAVNRPARGPGNWSGDWADAGGNRGMARGYSGRGPKDYRRSDDRIKEELCDLFTDDDRIDASEVSITVENGDVTLLGTVTTRDQKRRAEDLAERVSGVRDVINQLRITRGDASTGAAPSSGREKTARVGVTGQNQNVAADRSDR